MTTMVGKTISIASLHVRQLVGEWSPSVRLSGGRREVRHLVLPDAEKIVVAGGEHIWC